MPLSFYWFQRRRNEKLEVTIPFSWPRFHPRWVVFPNLEIFGIIYTNDHTPGFQGLSYCLCALIHLFKAMSTIPILCTYVHTGNKKTSHYKIMIYTRYIVYMVQLLEFFKWPLLELKKSNLHFNRNESHMLWFIYAVLPAFGLKRTCGVWKIFGDFQMWVNINFPIQNRKLG